MLRQESGADKTNMITRAPKVILPGWQSKERQISVKHKIRYETRWNRKKKAYLDVGAESKWGLQEFRMETLAIPTSVPNTANSAGICIYG